MTLPLCRNRSTAKDVKDEFDHPDHYTTDQVPSGIECWDHYELAMTEEEFRGAMKSNIYKYLFRAGRKESSSTIADLEKAKRYLNRLLIFESGKRISFNRPLPEYLQF